MLYLLVEFLHFSLSLSLCVHIYMDVDGFIIFLKKQLQDTWTKSAKNHIQFGLRFFLEVHFYASICYWGILIYIAFKWQYCKLKIICFFAILYYNQILAAFLLWLSKKFSFLDFCCLCDNPFKILVSEFLYLAFDYIKLLFIQKKKKKIISSYWLSYKSQISYLMKKRPSRRLGKRD